MDEIRDVCCRYFCEGCGHEWSATFEERVHIGRSGDEQDLFLRRGVPHTNPEVDTACPSCGDLRVQLLGESVRSA
jgi:hypothetical protein